LIKPVYIHEDGKVYQPSQITQLLKLEQGAHLHFTYVQEAI